MNYNHPYARYGKEIFVSLPVIPTVRGPVISVEAEPNVTLERGDVLFRIDPVPYELEIVRRRAKLADAGAGALEQEEAWKAARAQLTKARAQRDRAKQELDRCVAAGGAATRHQVENRKQAYLATEADVEAAEARVKQAQLQVDTQYQGEDARVARIQAELRAAEYDLEQTVVRAPADVMVTQVALRPGMMVVPAPLRPAMVFIPAERRTVVGSFWQNSLQRIEPGFEAEVILDAVPGHVFGGRVKQLLPAMREGEAQSGGTLISARMLAQFGRAAAVIELEEDLNDYGLPLGVRGKLAVSSDSFIHVAVMRKILLRMMGWLAYAFPIK